MSRSLARNLLFSRIPVTIPQSPAAWSPSPRPPCAEVCGVLRVTGTSRNRRCGVGGAPETGSARPPGGGIFAAGSLNVGSCASVFSRRPRTPIPSPETGRFFSHQKPHQPAHTPWGVRARRLSQERGALVWVCSTQDGFISKTFGLLHIQLSAGRSSQFPGIKAGTARLPAERSRQVLPGARLLGCAPSR